MMEKVTDFERHKSIAATNLQRKKQFQYAIVGEGIVIGTIVGVVISVFRLMLIYADEARNIVAEHARAGAAGALCMVVMLVVLALVITRLLDWESDIAGSGIPQVEGELKGIKDMKWWRVIIAKMIGCSLAIGGGLALGREGPSIQLGAMVGKGFARANHRLLTEERILITCGAGAGLSAAFGAPLAGAIFVLEELHRNFSGEVLFSTMAASAVADFVSVNIFGFTPVFNIAVTEAIPLKYYGLLIVLGVILGFFGMFYNRTIAFMQDTFGKINGRLGKLLVGFAVCFAMVYVYPIALGSGNELVAEIANGSFALKALVIMLAFKFVFSTMSFGTGAPGGIFLPLLVLGSVTGGLFSRVSETLLGTSPDYITGFVVVAMAGYFASIVHAPVTGIVLITEMTGSFEGLLPLVLVSLCSFLIADYFGGKPIYHQLLERMIDRRRPVQKDRKTIIDAEIHEGSYMDGRPVMEFGLPLGTLIISVSRGDVEIIPDGHTILRGGDEIEILLRDRDLEDIEPIIDERARHVDTSIDSEHID